ncbi:2-hydroxyacid dehydrogenase [Enterobacteriaceae bacterium BIT-l23]|uniref:2-hydroxyacid dehydrogenase n=1 Tax=Jejubacter calystegiae TaxID=2579935 RepID=A0A4P8YKG3_9ENTR|nr:2-hydroxyacid dehydrogenase [Jejubacter calystegiae]NUU67884.1 2-hydroxyacid dehydrogenase [Enterobacteriaceae bacterium BIT-l23]QCT21209.1 2-hydroxyacid dehydrogenase [Jejubacter calystegiae]
MITDILLIQPVPDLIDSALKDRYRVHRWYDMADREAFLATGAAGIQAVVTGGSFGLPNSIMDRLPALKIVAISGIGTDAVDLARARDRGIHVTTTPGVLTDDVADMAMGLMMMTLRDLVTGDRLVRAGQWGSVTQPLAVRVTGKRLGIVGLGQVGHAIAQRAQAFAMPVRYHSRRPRPESGYRYVDNLIALAQESDILVVAASADSQQAIITADVLRSLGPQGYLINVARGKLVDEEALIAALDQGQIAGAGLDVFASEPHVPAALLAHPGVVVQPHRASATRETRLAMGEIVLQNLAACAAGQRPPTSVTG